MSTTEQTTSCETAAESSADPVPAVVRELLSVYREQLEGVQFPDVSRASLETAADEHRACAAELGRLRAELDQARDALASSEQTLKHHADRALAYARIYAADNEPLRQALDAVEAVAAAATPKPAPRRKRRKRSDSASGAPELPFDGQQAESTAPTTATVQ